MSNKPLIIVLLVAIPEVSSVEISNITDKTAYLSWLANKGDQYDDIEYYLIEIENEDSSMKITSSGNKRHV